MKIDEIKKQCIEMGGSKLSCTSAMIAYDQYMAINKQNNIDK